jgi:DNA-binding MarR family transcriptional regulator
MEVIFTAGMQTNDLTARQLVVLAAVAENEGLSQTDLVERTGIDRSTLADVVKRLKGKGLLQRRRTKEDARTYAVKLTEDGQRMLRAAEPLAKRVDDRILDALPARQRDQFMGALASDHQQDHRQAGGRVSPLGAAVGIVGRARPSRVAEEWHHRPTLPGINVLILWSAVVENGYSVQS